MAVGDVVSGIALVATSDMLEIRPSVVGTEWVIHNIYYDRGIVEFNYTDGTNVLKFDSDPTAGARLGMCYHVTNANWIRITNLNASSTLVGYDGMQTK